MSDQPEPQLLSPERLKAIQQWAAFPLAEVGKHPHEYVAALSDLLADRAAFRQQVAAELRLLMYDESVLSQIEPADRVRCMLRNNQVKNAAKALKIDLSAPSPS